MESDVSRDSDFGNAMHAQQLSNGTNGVLHAGIDWNRRTCEAAPAASKRAP